MNLERRCLRGGLVIGVLAATFFTVGCGSAQHAPSQATPPVAGNDPRERLAIWEGRWTATGETKETAYSHAGTSPSHLTCGWSADHGYMVCEYLSDNADAEARSSSDHLSIFTYDEKGKRYKHLGISKDFRTLEETARVSGNVWQYEYELSSSLHGRDTYEFVTPDRHVTRIEFSPDGQQWTLVKEVVATRVQGG
jgi:hypothetical protein